ncbi:unnamed protein product [Sphacelaria rigidula]
MVTLESVLENQAINSRKADHLLDRVVGHAKGNLVGCKMDMWDCGRCSCRTPLLRFFDRFGRCVDNLSEDLVLL